jgi:hypothetical protein
MRARYSMNASNFFAGIVILLAGVLLFFAGPQFIMIPTTQAQVDSLFKNEAFVVGDIWERPVQLEEGVLVNGTVNVSSALTNEPSEISVLVVDDANYQKWVAHGSSTYILQKEMPNGQSFSFTAPRTAVYHFIFDNANSPVKKNVSMTVNLQREIVVNLPDERIRYVACGLVAIGLVVTVVGILRKTEVPWA